MSSLTNRLLVFAFGVLLAAAAPAGAQQDGDAVVARVGEATITLAEVEEAWQRNDSSSRLRMLQQLYDTRRRVLDIVVGEQLVARAAAARGVTRDELLTIELPSRTLEVTDAELDLIYERNKDRFGGRSVDEMRPEIRALVEEQRPMQALHAYMNELRLVAEDVVVLLEPPRQTIETLAEDPVKGSADAPIEIVEFSDFDCPFCRRATDTIVQILAKYGDQIRFVYKDYPLPSHPNAFKAAEAGNCANEQGKFWELHDKMFASQGVARRRLAQELCRGARSRHSIVRELPRQRPVCGGGRAGSADRCELRGLVDADPLHQRARRHGRGAIRHVR